jgi:hypothetical protein
MEMSQDLTSTSGPESQRQRWVKYGANVALTVALVIALAAVVAFLGQRFNKRIDTTIGGEYSLKPQTKAVLRDLKAPVTLVSLYSSQSRRGADRNDDQAQRVRDLLEEYRSGSRNIDVQIIDPVESPAKADALIRDVTERYGGEVQKYKAFLDEYALRAKQVKELTTAEAQRIGALPLDRIKTPELFRTIALIRNTVEGFPKLLESDEEQIQRRLKLKPPDYRTASERAQSSMEELSARVGQIAEDVNKSKDDPNIPEPIRAYFAESADRYAELKKLADELLANARNLGDLKLDTLRQSLRENDSILVMGPADIRVIPAERVWRVEETLKSFVRDGKPRPQFAGEQQVTTAIVAVTQPKKTRIVFVRPAGPSLTSVGFPPFLPSGRMSQVAERLREYGFEVLEKDLSGTFAVQAQMQGLPVEPEATDEQMKDAIWVVLAVPAGGQMARVPTNLGGKLADHLNAGGGALIIPFLQEQSVPPVLGTLGIDLRTDVLCVHESPPPGAAPSSGDPMDDVQRVPYVFDIREYGDHPLAAPLRSLESLMTPLVVKTTTTTEGTVTPILPIPDAPRAPPSWGETTLDFLQTGDVPKLDRAADLPGPLYGGAVAERKNGARVVVVSSPSFAFNQTLSEPDPELARRGIFVSRFPGNAELFYNSIFWLARMDTMISISPAAMQVSRIGAMSDAALATWRVGVLLVGLPGLVIVAGIMTYLARRD